MKLTLTSRDEVLIAVRCLRNYARFLIITNYNNMLVAHAAETIHFNSLNWFARWCNKDEIEALKYHPDKLNNFDQPLDVMVDNYIKWVNSYEILRWGNTPNTQTLRDSWYDAHEARRVKMLADQLNGTTPLHRINLQLNQDETDLLVRVMDKCPPNEYKTL